MLCEMTRCAPACSLRIFQQPFPSYTTIHKQDRSQCTTRRSTIYLVSPVCPPLPDFTLALVLDRCFDGGDWGRRASSFSKAINPRESDPAALFFSFFFRWPCGRPITPEYLQNTSHASSRAELGRKEGAGNRGMYAISAVVIPGTSNIPHSAPNSITVISNLHPDAGIAGKQIRGLFVMRAPALHPLTTERYGIWESPCLRVWETSHHRVGNYASPSCLRVPCSMFSVNDTGHVTALCIGE